MSKKLDAKYEMADLDNYFMLIKHLDNKQKISLKSFLNEYKHLFDAMLGDWKTDPVDLRLKPGEMPFQLSPFPVPEIHEEIFKKEIIRLCDLGVLNLKLSQIINLLHLFSIRKWYCPCIIRF
jgi:hypothetical protein